MEAHSRPTRITQHLSDIADDFKKVSSKLLEASYAIRRRGGYAYPVFIASRVPVTLGALLIVAGEMNNQWNYYAAYLDILVQYGLIAGDKMATFQQTYKDPEAYSCLLVRACDFSNLVYIPYRQN